MATDLTMSRSEWATALAALPAAEVQGLAGAIATRYRVEDVSLPESGLALLPLRDSALEETFYLGEVPVSQARVRLLEATGRCAAEGGTVLLDDRAQLARCIAVLDAALAARVDGWEAIAVLIERGQRRRDAQTALRRRFLARTRVDFSLLGPQEEDGDDD